MTAAGGSLAGQFKRDILIIGGGPAGAAAAAVFAQQGRAVTVVEEQQQCLFKVGETLPGTAVVPMNAAGMGNALREVPQLRCAGNRSSWGSPNLQIRPSLMSPFGAGWLLDRVALDTALRQAATARGAELLSGTRLTTVSRCDDGWHIRLKRRGRVFERSCRWVLDATGRRASFARSHGAKRIAFDRQVAIVSVLDPRQTEDVDLTILIEAVENGWWYTARTPAFKRVVMFFTDGDLVEGSGVKQEGGWREAVARTRYMRQFADEQHWPSALPRGVVLADTSCLDRPAGDGWVAVGDAAAALDPLSSAGITEALVSATSAARAIMATDAGGPDHIDQYVSELQARHRKNLAIRERYYRLENRWPKSAFWARRRHLRRTRM